MIIITRLLDQFQLHQDGKTYEDRNEHPSRNSQERVGAHDLELAGIFGRPLYQCGAVKLDSGSCVNSTSSDREAKLEDFYCNNVASMSRLLQFRNEQTQWQCTS